MLAKEYGYWISPGPAGGCKPTEQWLREEIPKAVRWTRKVGLSVFSIGAVAVTLIFVFGVTESEGWYVGLAPAGGTLFGGLLVLIDPKTRQFKRAIRPLGESPWQAWPCRVGGSQEASGVPAGHSVITLLDSTRHPVRRFHGAMPYASWKRMADGFGVLWLCGDLRLNVVVADPGGAPIWIMRPLPDGIQGLAAAQPSLFDAAADAAVREAGAAATQRLLGQIGW